MGDERYCRYKVGNLYLSPPRRIWAVWPIFSAAADIKSPNYLKMIIEGKRNLSEDMISKFAKACSLNKSQGDEFKLLVLFNQFQKIPYLSKYKKIVRLN